MSQALITRLPYAKAYDPKQILKFVSRVDERGLICLAIPLHIESPNNAGVLIHELESSGLTLVSVISWIRDRHIVTTNSRRLTNTHETIAIFSRSKKYVLNRDAATKVKRGFESRENPFDDDNFTCCIGDSWIVNNDRSDRRFLPREIVLNLGQLSDLHPGDVVLDPFGNPGVQAACKDYGWEYCDGGLPSDARLKRGSHSSKNETEAE